VKIEYLRFKILGDLLSIPLSFSFATILPPGTHKLWFPGVRKSNTGRSLELASFMVRTIE